MVLYLYTYGAKVEFLRGLNGIAQSVGGFVSAVGGVNRIVTDATGIGFFNAATVAQRAAYTQTYSTATRTHANPTAAALTDNSGGSASGTLAAITGGGAGCENATKNAIASLAAQIAALIIDHANTKGMVNSLVDDSQALGFAT